MCSAREDGDHFVLDGTKLWVTSASHADMFLVFARTAKLAKKHQGVTAFVVERTTPGFRVTRW